jgi:hypothetical protein
MLVSFMTSALLFCGYMLLTFCVLVFMLQFFSQFFTKIEAKIISVGIRKINFDHKNVESNFYKLVCRYEYQLNDHTYISENTNPMIGVLSLKKESIEKIIANRVNGDRITIKVFPLFPKFCIAFPNEYNKLIVLIIFLFSFAIVTPLH